MHRRANRIDGPQVGRGIVRLERFGVALLAAHAVARLVTARFAAVVSTMVSPLRLRFRVGQRLVRAIHCTIGLGGRLLKRRLPMVLLFVLRARALIVIATIIATIIAVASASAAARAALSLVADPDCGHRLKKDFGMLGWWPGV